MVSQPTSVRVALGAACLGTSLVTGPSQAIPGAATEVYAVTAGPAYSTSRTLATNHQLDCTASNPYWESNACTLNVNVVPSSGCLWETQSTDAGAAPRKTPCAISITGPVNWWRAPAYCVLASQPLAIQVAFTPGAAPGSLLSPVVFQATASLVPTAFTSTGLATRSYQLTVKANGSVANVGPSGPTGVGNLFEVFAVDFAVPVSDACPNEDTDTLSRGNVRDLRADVAASNAATYGYVNTEVSAPV